MSNNSWLHMKRENERHALPQVLRERDPMGARDCGWVEQMLPFVRELPPAGHDTAPGRLNEQDWIIDPFCGFASTLVAASLAGRPALGVELSAERAQLARERLALLGLNATRYPVITGNLADDLTASQATSLHCDQTERRRITLCLTNVPYFGCTVSPDPSLPDAPDQLYRQRHYETYLQGLRDVFVAVHRLLEPGGWCVVMAQNLRLGQRFVPLAWDLARLLGERFALIDERILVYDKAGNVTPNLAKPDISKPSVYGPSNRAHEYALICRKQAQAMDPEAARAILADMSAAGFAHQVYGSYARLLAGEPGTAPNDIDLLVPADEAAVSRLMQWLEARGFRIESWNAPAHAPVAIEALAYRHYFRARRLDQDGQALQIDIAIAQCQRSGALNNVSLPE